MAIHTELPIYKLAYDLMLLAHDFTRNFSRDFKQSLGKRLHDECVAMAVLIGRANAANNKVEHITSLLEHLQVAELMMRLSLDLRCISHGQYARAIELTDRIGKQAGGWRKHSRNNPNPAPSAAPTAATEEAGSLFSVAALPAA